MISRGAGYQTIPKVPDAAKLFTIGDKVFRPEKLSIDDITVKLSGPDEGSSSEGGVGVRGGIGSGKLSAMVEEWSGGYYLQNWRPEKYLVGYCLRVSNHSIYLS